MESESIDPRLISNTASVFTDTRDISDFNPFEAHGEQTTPSPCQCLSWDDNGNLQFYFCPRCEQQDLSILEGQELPPLIANNGIGIEPQDAAFGSSQLETSATYWSELAGSQSLSLGAHDQQTSRPEKQRSSRQRPNRVSKPRRMSKKIHARSKNIHPTTIVARLQQSLQTDPSCSPKFKSECSKLLDQVKGLMYVEMGQPKSKNSLKISHMRDYTSAGSSESSKGSVGPLANDIFSISGGSNSVAESFLSSKPHSQHSQEPVRSISPSQIQAQNHDSHLYQCTYRACTSSFATKTDWKRHEGSEKHWLQQKYMCLECQTSATDMMECLYCTRSAEDVGDIRMHNLECIAARKQGRTFTRKDHFRSHLRNDHGLPLTPAASSWVYAIESEWPRQCGFCGAIVDTWAQRANHIEEHFKKGCRITSWKLPFPRIPDPKGKAPRMNSDDGSDNSSTSSSSNDSVFSAKDRCAVGALANYGVAAKDVAENRNLPVGEERFYNTQEVLAHQTGVLSTSSVSSQSHFHFERWRRFNLFFAGSRNSSQSRREDRGVTRWHRHCVPDDDRKFVVSILSWSGKTLVVNHRKRIYDEDAPVSVTATSHLFVDATKRVGRKCAHKPKRPIDIALRPKRGTIDVRGPGLQKRDIFTSQKTVTNVPVSDIHPGSITEKDKYARSRNTSKGTTLKTPLLPTLAYRDNYTMHRYLSDRYLAAAKSVVYLPGPISKLTEPFNRSTDQIGTPEDLKNSSELRGPMGLLGEIRPMEMNPTLGPKSSGDVPGTVPSSVPFESPSSPSSPEIAPARPKVHAVYAGLSKGPISPTSSDELSKAPRYRHPTSTNFQRRSNLIASRSASAKSSVSSSTSLETRLDMISAPWDDGHGTFTYGYDLLCEFTFAGCYLRFHSEAYEEWIDHSISHFGGHGPPEMSICTFCSKSFGCHEAVGIEARIQVWRQRMQHINRHFYENKRWDGLRVNYPHPDFHLIEHLNAKRLLSHEDYQSITGYTERPRCVGLVPLDYKTPEMLCKKERSLVVLHDLGKEARQRRKERRQGDNESKNRKPSQGWLSASLAHRETSIGNLGAVVSELPHSSALGGKDPELCLTHPEHGSDANQHQCADPTTNTEFRSLARGKIEC